MRKKTNRIVIVAAIVAAIVAILFLAWLELAVGVFGTPWAGS